MGVMKPNVWIRSVSSPVEPIMIEPLSWKLSAQYQARIVNFFGMHKNCKLGYGPSTRWRSLYIAPMCCENLGQPQADPSRKPMHVAEHFT